MFLFNNLHSILLVGYPFINKQDSGLPVDGTAQPFV